MFPRTYAVLATTLAASFSFAGNAQDGVERLYEQGRQQLPGHWRALGKTPDAAVFVHIDVKKTPQGYYRLWRSRELLAPGYIDKEIVYRSVREQILIDCSDARIGTSSRAYLAGHFGTGAVTARNDIAPVEWVAILPDTLDEQLLRTICPTKPVKPAKPIKSAPTKN